MNETFDPWATAAALGLTVKYARLYDAWGYYLAGTIWVDDRLNAVEARVALTHEIVHYTQGHHGAQPPKVEELVCRVTARWLVPWHRLMAVWGEQLPLEATADELCVTPQVIRDRVAYACPEELAMLERRSSCEWSAA